METVRIIYSKEENVTFCMWKYFFDSCGVWVMPQSAKQTNEDNKRPKLYILSEKDKMQINPKERSQTVYLVSQELYDLLEPHERNRSDIIVISWQKLQMRKNAQRVFITLTGSTKETRDLYELYDIFLKYELWGMAWLFTEFPQKKDFYLEKYIWDESIYTACSRAIADMERIKNKYSDFAKIYYSYIEKDVKYRQSTSDIMREMYPMFAMVQEYREEYEKNNNFNDTAVYYLCFRICEMSSAEKSSKILFLRSIEPEDYTAELVYEIAKTIEEGKHPNLKEVIEWYYKSYLLKNYKAGYELAWNFFKIGYWTWQEVLTLYQDMLGYIRREKKYPCISISHIEYEYKIRGKISDIYFKIIKARDEAREMQLDLQRMHENLNNRTEFDMILKCMFKNEDDRILYFNGIIHHIKYKIFSEVPFNFVAI